MLKASLPPHMVISYKRSWRSSYTHQLIITWLHSPTKYRFLTWRVVMAFKGVQNAVWHSKPLNNGVLLPSQSLNTDKAVLCCSGSWAMPLPPCLHHSFCSCSSQWGTAHSSPTPQPRVTFLQVSKASSKSWCSERLDVISPTLCPRG